MRDINRLQDVVDYRVSPSQLRPLLLGLLAVTCAVFAVGVSVGKRLEPGSPAMAMDTLSGLDEAAIPSGRNQGAVESEPLALTYHDELTQPEGALRLPPVESATDSDTRARRPPGDLPSAESETIPNAAPVTPEVRRPVPSEPAQIEAPQPGESSIFTLQVGSFDTQEEASQFAAGLRSRGHPTFIVQTRTESRGTWYRVRVGPFNSRREATGYQTRFERTERLPTFLVQRRVG